MNLKRANTNRVIIHCTNSVKDFDMDLKDIEKETNKKCGGYHYIIKRDGSIIEGIREDNVGDALDNFNSSAIHVCLVGGAKTDITGSFVTDFNYEEEQINSLSFLVDDLKLRHIGLKEVFGRCDLTASEDSPCFNVPQWFETGTIEEISGRKIVG